MISETPKMTFDQLQRYRLVADLIDSIRDHQPLTILDAGSHQGFLRQFLGDDIIINLDRNYFVSRNFVQSDVLQLPFASGSMDLLLALDILEHIPPRSRVRFLEELARTTRDILKRPWRWI